MAIIKHDCPKKDSPGYKYQTEKYGIGKVVANPVKGGGFRCTICGAEILTKAENPKKKVKP